MAEEISRVLSGWGPGPFTIKRSDGEPDIEVTPDADGQWQLELTSDVAKTVTFNFEMNGKVVKTMPFTFVDIVEMRDVDYTVSETEVGRTAMVRTAPIGGVDRTPFPNIPVRFYYQDTDELIGKVNTNKYGIAEIEVPAESTVGARTIQARCGAMTKDLVVNWRAAGTVPLMTIDELTFTDKVLDLKVGDLSGIPKDSTGAVVPNKNIYVYDLNLLTNVTNEHTDLEGDLVGTTWNAPDGAELSSPRNLMVYCDNYAHEVAAELYIPPARVVTNLDYGVTEVQIHTPAFLPFKVVDPNGVPLVGEEIELIDQNTDEVLDTQVTDKYGIVEFTRIMSQQVSDSYFAARGKGVREGDSRAHIRVMTYGMKSAPDELREVMALESTETDVASLITFKAFALGKVWDFMAAECTVFIKNTMTKLPVTVLMDKSHHELGVTVDALPDGLYDAVVCYGNARHAVQLNWGGAASNQAISVEFEDFTPSVLKEDHTTRLHLNTLDNDSVLTKPSHPMKMTVRNKADLSDRGYGLVYPDGVARIDLLTLETDQDTSPTFEFMIDDQVLGEFTVPVEDLKVMASPHTSYGAIEGNDYQAGVYVYRVSDEQPVEGVILDVRDGVDNTQLIRGMTDKFGTLDFTIPYTESVTSRRFKVNSATSYYFSKTVYWNDLSEPRMTDIRILNFPEVVNGPIKTDVNVEVYDHEGNKQVSTWSNYTFTPGDTSKTSFFINDAGLGTASIGEFTPGENKVWFMTNDAMVSKVLTFERVQGVPGGVDMLGTADAGVVNSDITLTGKILNQYGDIYLPPTDESFDLVMGETTAVGVIKPTGEFSVTANYGVAGDIEAQFQIGGESFGTRTIKWRSAITLELSPMSQTKSTTDSAKLLVVLKDNDGLPLTGVPMAVNESDSGDSVPLTAGIVADSKIGFSVILSPKERPEGNADYTLSACGLSQAFSMDWTIRETGDGNYLKDNLGYNSVYMTKTLKTATLASFRAQIVDRSGNPVPGPTPFGTFDSYTGVYVDRSNDVDENGWVEFSIAQPDPSVTSFDIYYGTDALVSSNQISWRAGSPDYQSLVLDDGVSATINASAQEVVLTGKVLDSNGDPTTFSNWTQSPSCHGTDGVSTKPTYNSDGTWSLTRKYETAGPLTLSFTSYYGDIYLGDIDLNIV